MGTSRTIARARARKLARITRLAAGTRCEVCEIRLAERVALGRPHGQVSFELARKGIDPATVRVKVPVCARCSQDPARIDAAALDGILARAQPRE